VFRCRSWIGASRDHRAAIRVRTFLHPRERVVIDRDEAYRRRCRGSRLPEPGMPPIKKTVERAILDVCGGDAGAQVLAVMSFSVTRRRRARRGRRQACPTPSDPRRRLPLRSREFGSRCLVNNHLHIFREQICDRPQLLHRPVRGEVRCRIGPAHVSELAIPDLSAGGNHTEVLDRALRRLCHRGQGRDAELPPCSQGGDRRVLKRRLAITPRPRRQVPEVAAAPIRKNCAPERSAMPKGPEPTAAAAPGPHHQTPN